MAETKQAVVTKTIIREGTLAVGVRFEFANGKDFAAFLYELPGRRENDDLGACPILAEAACHGLSQKIGDATAISRNTETGASASVEDKYAAAREVYERIMSGRWNAEREGGGNEGGILARAIATVKGVELAKAKEFVAKLNAEQKKALRANAKVADAIRAIEAERTAGIDSDALLDDLS